MKIHKSTLLWTGVTAVAALILYSIFGYMECLKNQWIADISLAIFGSALLLVVTSIIGYRIEKKELRWKIVQESDSFRMIDGILEEGNQLSTQALARITNMSLNRLKNFYNIVSEYYQGCIVKDKDLKILINNEIIPYAERIANFQVKIAKPDQAKDVIQQAFNELWNTDSELRNKVDKWMHDKQFAMGKEFNIDKEKEQEKND